ncbi:MAG: DUF362 domain-containing protein [Thermodesulfobacteriota bacterium]
MKKPRVILRKCPDYQVDRIRGIMEESVSDLKAEIKGKVFIKPNVVTANRRYIHDSYTHPSVTAAMIRLVKARNPESLVVGESGGFGIPTRLFFKESGYMAMCREEDARLVDLNEHALVQKTLSRAAWHKTMLLSRFIAEADTKIWLPKLKYHIFASITCALKLNIGILAHKERMAFHDWRIHEKIVDLLEPGYPHLAVADAVNITYGFESAPYPVHLGALLFSDNPLAMDVVAAHIMGYNPKDVKHLAIASARGYGSLALSDIEIGGDADLETLRAMPKGQPRLFQHLNELETPIRFFAGRAPDTAEPCDGGCEGALKGCLGTIEKRRPGSLAQARPGAIVTGIYEGDVEAPDQPVLLIGTCTEVTGKLTAGKVTRIKGCPMGARDLFITVPKLFGLPSPMLDFRDASLFIGNSVAKGARILTSKIAG